MRFDRPVGTLLLLWPTLGALWMANKGLPPTSLLLIFIMGTIATRAAGCVINDFIDRKYDRHVQRTRNRPLTTGAITEFEALAILALLCTISLILVSLLNRFTLFFSLGGAFIAAVYPFMKRWTYMPQVVLGAAFSWGIPMAFAASQNTVPAVAWLLFTASLLWIIAYDTLYAMLDRDDDLKLGIKSTAILFGDVVRPAIAGLQLATTVCFFILGHNLKYGTFFNITVLIIAGLFIYQQHLIRSPKKPQYFAAFNNNIWVGFALFTGVVLEESILPLLG
ncbi:MAG: 4-hydroxybenzoate octaprenyltransferase [Pseudomonadales bacterium]|nr:4-hydroxybenzoate octaprenyltransferase [Pseudomonadales bacterium]